MKLSAWMARERLDDELLAARIEAAGGSCSPHTVAKWRRHERTPRGQNMALLMAVTDNEVTANDFVESPPIAAASEQPETVG
jgi:hypothetical protein